MPFVEGETLKDLLDANQGQLFRVLFTDGEEFELKLGHWWQDFGEEPHADATVVTVINSRRSWKSGAAISFGINEIERLAEPISGRVVFKS